LGERALEIAILRGALDSSGSGSGSGSGEGYGDGYGDGSGYGSGDGYGNGYDDGSGYGDGYGDGGNGSYWAATIAHFSSKWTESQRARLDALAASGAKLAFWLSDEKGNACNGGKKMTPAAPGVVHTSGGPLKLCSKGTLHATLMPLKWEGSRWWIVALIGDVIGNDEKYGALKREIIGEAL
jgi:hypothetical protein